MTVKPIFVKPALDKVNPERAGLQLIVRDPDRAYAPIPNEGTFVHPTGYWITMLRDGAVVKCDPPTHANPVVQPSAAAGNARPRRAASH